MEEAAGRVWLSVLLLFFGSDLSQQTSHCGKCILSKSFKNKNQNQKLHPHGFGLRAEPQGFMGGAAQGLGGLSVPAGHRSASSGRENGGESRARALGPAALRAALYLVFSLPSLQSCIRVVAFPIVSGDRPRTVQILGLLLLLVQANKVFFLSFFF